MRCGMAGLKQKRHQYFDKNVRLSIHVARLYNFSAVIRYHLN